MDNSTATTPVTAAIKDDVDRIRTDVDLVRSDVSRLAGDTARAARVGAAEARHRLDRGARAVVLRGRQSLRIMGHRVAAHPFLAVGSALGVGLLAGYALTRNRRPQAPTS
jgi:ElaB/YqjD/DUF883 family membrane-anchored ribosome-binding protein